MVEMTVYSLTTTDPTRNQEYMVWLRSVEDGMMLPIVIGTTEAMSIHGELYSEKAQRPLTHDLMRSVLDHFEVEVEEVKIVDLKDGIFFAELVLSVDGATVRLDARPSDSIAMALKYKAPVFVAEKVLKEAAYKVEMVQEDSLLEHLNPASPLVAGNGVHAGDGDVTWAVRHLLEETGLSKSKGGKAAAQMEVADLKERIRELKQLMDRAVKGEQYEEAGALRDEIHRLEGEGSF